jgi:hypothetical protein
MTRDSSAIDLERRMTRSGGPRSLNQGKLSGTWLDLACAADMQCRYHTSEHRSLLVKGQAMDTNRLLGHDINVSALYPFQLSLPLIAL